MEIQTQPERTTDLDCAATGVGSIGIMLPIVAFMMFLQRHLVRGIRLGAVKG